MATDPIAVAIAESLSVVAQNLRGTFQEQVELQVQERVGQFFTKFAGSMKRSLGQKQGFQRAHQEVANVMREKTLVLYESRVEGRKPGASYRIGQNRFSGGLLRRALEGPEMFVGTAQGILMGNRAILDKEAAHWYRLNFGAGPQSSVAPPRTLTIGDQSATIRAFSESSPAFQMPYGSWRAGSGGFGFYPGSHGRGGLLTPSGSLSKRPEFSSIQGRNFFDGGVFALTQELPVVYNALVERMVSAAAKKAQGG